MKKYFISILFCFSVLFTSAFLIPEKAKAFTMRELVDLLISIGAISSDNVKAAIVIADNVDQSSVNNNLSITCSANDTFFNVGDIITWTANVSGNTSGYTYAWSDNESNFSLANSKVVSKTYTTQGVKTATVYVKSGATYNKATCSATVIQSKYVSCMADFARIPLGNSTTWTAIVGGDTSNYKYKWSDNDGSSSVTDKTFTKTYSTDGIKTATLEVTDEIGKSTKITCDQLVAGPNVNPMPSALTASCSSDVKEITKGSSITFSANSSGGTFSPVKDMELKYYWYDTDGDEGYAGPNVTKIYTKSGKKTATVRVTSGAVTIFTKCDFNVIDPKLPMPTPTPAPAKPGYLSCVASSPRVSVGSPITWSAIVSGGSGKYTYSWSDNEGSSIVGDQTVTKTYNTAGVKTATLTVNDDAGNGATIACETLVYDPAATESLLSPLQASCSSNVKSIAKGGGIYFTIDSIGGNGGYTYHWSDTDGDEGDAGYRVFKTYPTSGNKTMSVEVTSGTQTVNTSCDFNVVDSSPVPTPTPKFPLKVSCYGIPNPAFTIGDKITWTAIASGGVKNYQYSWSDNEGSSSEGGASISKVYSSSGIKTATIKVTSGDQAVSANCSVVVLNINAEMSVSCSAGSRVVGVGKSVTWTATPSGTLGNETYTWSDDEETIYNTGPNVTKTYSMPGIKTANVVMKSGLITASSKCTVDVSPYVVN